MKIAQVITRMNIGGAQESVLLTCIGHIQKGDQVTLISGPSEGPEGKMLEKMPPPKEMAFIDVPHLQRELSLSADIKAYHELVKIFKENDFDVVHTNSSKAGILARMAAWKCHVPLVVHTIHGQAFHRYERPWKNKMYIAAERYAAKRCHRIYAVADAMIQQCIDAHVAPRAMYELVYTGMDLEPYLNAQEDPALKKKLGFPENAIIIGTIARLFPLKGYEQLIPAAITLVKKNPQIYFMFLGDGIMRPELEKRVADAGVADHFKFMGMINPEEIPQHAALMTMLAHLSLREGLPRGVVQALAAAKPVLAFNLDGTPEVVMNDKSGIILPPDASEAQCVEAMEKLCTNPELAHKLGLGGRERVRRDFDWHFMADTLREKYARDLHHFHPEKYNEKGERL